MFTSFLFLTYLLYHKKIDLSSTFWKIFIVIFLTIRPGAASTDASRCYQYECDNEKKECDDEKKNLHKPPRKFLLPSLRPHALSRVVRCLWSTNLYTESPSYGHLCVTPVLALRLCGEWPNYLGRLGLSSFPLTLILYHILMHLSRGFWKIF